jgi:hypothetical protein
VDKKKDEAGSGDADGHEVDVANVAQDAHVRLKIRTGTNVIKASPGAAVGVVG